MRFKDLTGQKVGEWFVLSLASRYRGQVMWRCRCVCGVEKEMRSSALSRKVSYKLSCGCLRNEKLKGMSREKNRNWRGGRHVDDGYVFIYQPEHPRSKSNGYIREHTLVMERKLGRYLTKGENVHHINGDRQDNSIENLELWSISQPPGQRIADKVSWAKEILKLYEENNFIEGAPR